MRANGRKLTETPRPRRTHSKWPPGGSLYGKGSTYPCSQTQTRCLGGVERWREEPVWPIEAAIWDKRSNLCKLGRSR